MLTLNLSGISSYQEVAAEFTLPISNGVQKIEDSDIDLIIVSNDFQGMNLRERSEVLGITAARIMKPIEARGYTTQEIKATPSSTNFLKEILTASVVI